MKALHSVKIEGVWYRAGEEIPGTDVAEEPVAVSETKKHDDLSEIHVSEVELNRADIAKRDFKIATKSDVEKMRKDALVRLGTFLGLPDAENRSREWLRIECSIALGF